MKPLSIKLVQKRQKGRKTRYKWIGSDGFDYSPIFTDETEAADFPIQVGLIRQDELGSPATYAEKDKASIEEMYEERANQILGSGRSRSRGDFPTGQRL